MTISQIKVDLAVLYKLHQHAEFDGEAITPEDVARYFQCHMPLRRVELALEELASRGDIQREYDPHHFEEGLWKITRQGLERVDRALRTSTSFVARLHANGDDWLNSEEAQQAVLKKLTEPSPAAAPPFDRGEATDAPSTMENTPPDQLRPAIDWTKWGTIGTLISVVVAIVLWWFS